MKMSMPFPLFCDSHDDDDDDDNVGHLDGDGGGCSFGDADDYDDVLRPSTVW